MNLNSNTNNINHNKNSGLSENSGNNQGLASGSWFAIFSLIFSGEMIFSLPFHVARFFRPTLLDAFQLSNSDLGDTFALYGITAMLCYFPGGVIADYFSARRLLTFSLIATALGGIAFAQIPQGINLYLLFAYWGLTTILLFWAGMIKATREWGGSTHQGSAFGLLDGGRGLVAAIMSSIAVFFFSQWFHGRDLVQQDDGIAGLKAVIYFYTFVTLLAAFFVWKFIPAQTNQGIKQKRPWMDMQHAMTSSKVWLQACIIICAYCAYKAGDNYGLYAVTVLGMDQVDAATFTSLTAYLRPIGAIGAGLLADRIGAGRVIQWLFILLVVFYSLLSFSWPTNLMFNIALFNLVVSFLAVFALRGIYFALVEESKINYKVTGTAVGFISLVGYTPDVFFASVAGRILDADPGVTGFENYFLLMMAISLVGIVASIILLRQNTLLKNIATT